MQASGDKSTGETASPPSGCCCRIEKAPIPVELEDGRTPLLDRRSVRQRSRQPEPSEHAVVEAGHGADPITGLERVTKPPKPDPPGGGSVKKYGRRAASRSVMGSCRTVLANSIPSVTRRTAAGLRSRVPHRHSFPPPQRHSLADAPARTRVRVGDDVLASPARLAVGGCVGSRPLRGTRLARAIRLH
jgi:hypothetical protein